MTMGALEAPRPKKARRHLTPAEREAYHLGKAAKAASEVEVAAAKVEQREHARKAAALRTEIGNLLCEYSGNIGSLREILDFAKEKFGVAREG